MAEPRGPGRRPGTGREKAKPSILGQRMLLARRAAGVTQAELGEEAGLSGNTVARVERGDVQFLRSDIVARVARALNVSTDYLLGLDNEQPASWTDENERFPAETEALASV